MTEGTATRLQGRRRIIERPRLTRLLDESHARVKMLVAPAGYGKSTLARQWTAVRPRAWYRIPAAAADVAAVSRGIAIAAADVLPGCSGRLEERLRITKNPDAEFATLAEMLIEDLDAWPNDAWLVLDDAQHALEREPTSEFLSALVREAPVNALLCTRQRPEWITARDLLYGHALEIGRNSLAMTHDEAAAVMPDTAATAGVVALADGWPAVVGLASLTPEPTLMSGMTAGLPEALYDYLAEELYQALPAEIQGGMCLIAVAGVRSRRLIAQLLPARDQDKVLREVVDAGWLTSDADGNLELHPLLEAFLRQKLEGEPTPDARAKAERIVDTLIAEQHWDEAFSVVERYAVDEKLLPLLRSALDDLLASGRTAALQEWIAYAERRSISGPELDLTSAELLFREGRFHESEVRASTASERFSPSDLWTSRSFAVAGRAAHAANREEEAVAFYRSALVSAKSQADRHVAALGELVAAIDLELPEAPSLLKRLTPERDDVDALTHYVSRSLGLHTRFGTPLDLSEARRVYRLLHLARDPIARCSFRNTYGYTMAIAGHVEEAREVVAAQLQDARRYRLDFVIPYARVIEALSELVAGNFKRVERLLTKIEHAGKLAGDDLLVAGCIAIRTRSLVAQGRFKDAARESMKPLRAVTRAMQGEVLASRALALACDRNDVRARATADMASAATQAVEARAGVAATQAVIAMNSADPHVFDLARTALDLSTALHSVEFFITAYRGAPQLAQILMDADDTREAILHVLALSDDQEVLRLERGTALSGTWEELSPREREVLALVAEGLSNREIGRRLYIAEATVKVHISHIFDKFDVSSRTAAALRVPHHARIRQRPDQEPGAKGRR